EQCLQRREGGQFFVVVRALVMGLQIQRTLEAAVKERAQQAHVVDGPLSDRPPLAAVGPRVPPGIPQMNVIDAFLVEMVVAVGTRPFAGTVGVVRIPEKAQVRNCLEQARGFRAGFCRGSSDVFQQENAAGRARNLTGLLQVLHDAIEDGLRTVNAPETEDAYETGAEDFRPLYGSSEERFLFLIGVIVFASCLGPKHTTIPPGMEFSLSAALRPGRLKNSEAAIQLRRPVSPRRQEGTEISQRHHGLSRASPCTPGVRGE